jgi:hypothetical protein
VSYYSHFGEAIYVYGGADERDDLDRRRAIRLGYEHPNSWGINVVVRLPFGGRIRTVARGAGHTSSQYVTFA